MDSLPTFVSHAILDIGLDDVRVVVDRLGDDEPTIAVLEVVRV